MDLADACRKVSSACLYLLSATPTHTLPVVLDPDELAEQADRMDLHRAVMRGNGFYDWMTRPVMKGEVAEAMASLRLDELTSPAVRPLPVVNLLAIDNGKYVDTSLHEVLPEDRVPFLQYLSNRILGIGIITAVSCLMSTLQCKEIADNPTLQAPGFGKTTLLAVAGFAIQASLGPVLCSGPSNVAVDNLARRLDRITKSVCERYNNQDEEVTSPTRARHRLVVRGYNKQRELDAFISLFKDPAYAPSATKRKRKNPWRLHLSVAYWLLVLLGSSVGTLHDDDSEALHLLRREIERRADLGNLRAVAAGQMSWQEFEAAEDIGALVKNELSSLMSQIVDIADMLCTTPAQATSERGDYVSWAERTARGVLIDEVYVATVSLTLKVRSTNRSAHSKRRSPTFEPSSLIAEAILSGNRLEKSCQANLSHRLSYLSAPDRSFLTCPSNRWDFGLKEPTTSR